MKRCLACEQRFEAPGWRCPVCRFAPSLEHGFPEFAPGLAADEVRYDARRFAALADVEDRHFWFRARAELILWAMRRHFPRARSFLEIGCGTGNVLDAIARGPAPARLAACDAHVQGLAFAARRVPAAELLQIDARRIPFREEFDVVGAFDVIEHIADDGAALAEIFAACRAGGGVILTVPQHPWLWSYRDEFARHCRRYSRAQLLARLRRAGFERLWCTSFVSLLLPMLAWSRRRQRDPDDFDAAAELRVGPLANHVCYALMRAERALIAAGASLPVGGSLLALAHKPAATA